MPLYLHTLHYIYPWNFWNHLKRHGINSPIIRTSTSTPTYYSAWKLIFYTRLWTFELNFELNLFRTGQKSLSDEQLTIATASRQRSQRQRSDYTLYSMSKYHIHTMNHINKTTNLTTWREKVFDPFFCPAMTLFNSSLILCTLQNSERVTRDHGFVPFMSRAVIAMALPTFSNQHICCSEHVSR